MAMNNAQVRLWVQLKWWVDAFLWVSLWVIKPVAWALPENVKERYVDGVGYVIGRWGVRVYVNRPNT